MHSPAIAATLAVLLAQATPALASMNLGQNLDSITYYSPAAVFANSMKSAKPWMTRSVNGSEWDSGKGDEGTNQIPKRTDGYPSYIPFSVGGVNQFVHTQIPVYEDGNHRISITGSGTVRITGPGYGKTTHAVNGTLVLNLNFTGANKLSDFDSSGISQRKEPSNIYLEITQSASANPIRDIRVMRPNYNTAGRDDFDNSFKTRVGYYRAIRFMDWQRTNNSERTTFHINENNKGYYTQATRNGISADHIIDLANQLDKDIWICVPHRFTNQAVNDMGYKFARSLEAGRMCYVEYSNEVWNNMFAQHTWVNTNVTGANLPQKYGTKANEIFGTFLSQFTNAGRAAYLKRVLAGQSANSWVLQEALKTAGSRTDMIAIAPYFGKVFTSVPSPLPTLDQLDDDNYSELSQVRTHLDAHKTLAQTNSKTLVCYEGGQHYVGARGAENDTALTDRLLDFNRDYRMRNIYRYNYLSDINTRGISLFTNFSMVSRWSKWGSWGASEWNTQTIGTGANDAQKEWAIRDWKTNNP